MEAVSNYSVKAMTKILTDEKKAIAGGKRTSPKEKENQVFELKPFKPLRKVVQTLFGVTEVPEGGIVHTSIKLPESTYSIPILSSEKKTVMSILALLKKRL